MGNNQHTCPTHSGNQLTKICMCQQCLQPLCKHCIDRHISIHHKLGFPPKLQDYKVINKQLGKKEKGKKRKEEQALQELTPTSLLIKDLTKQYFQKNSANHPAQILQNLEIWKDLHEDPSINRKISEFLDKNLLTNEGVVGQKISHLY